MMINEGSRLSWAGKNFQHKGRKRERMDRCSSFRSSIITMITEILWLLWSYHSILIPIIQCPKLSFLLLIHRDLNLKAFDKIGNEFEWSSLYDPRDDTCESFTLSLVFLLTISYVLHIDHECNICWLIYD